MRVERENFLRNRKFLKWSELNGSYALTHRVAIFDLPLPAILIMTSQSVTPSVSTPAVMSTPLEFGMAFADLYRREGLLRLDQAFLHFLQEGEPALRARLDQARANPDSLDRKAESALLIEVAPWMEDFIARLFGIEKEVAELAARHHELAPLYSCKRQFV